jgi:hypothetical protein
LGGVLGWNTGLLRLVVIFLTLTHTRPHLQSNDLILQQKRAAIRNVYITDFKRGVTMLSIVNKEVDVDNMIELSLL